MYVLRTIAIWMMMVATVPALGGAAWAIWQYNHIDFPVISLSDPPIVTPAKEGLIPGKYFAITWRYDKTEHCNGRKVVSLWDRENNRYIRMYQIDSHWQLGLKRQVTEYYYIPEYTPVDREYVIVLDTDYWCNFIRSVSQRIETVTVKVGNGDSNDISP